MKQNNIHKCTDKINESEIFNILKILTWQRWLCWIVGLNIDMPDTRNKILDLLL